MFHRPTLGMTPRGVGSAGGSGGPALSEPQFVGGRTDTTENASKNVSLTSLTGGLAAAPAEGDLVIVAVSSAGTGVKTLNATGTWQKLDNLGQSGANYHTSLSIFWKRMGAVPDTTFPMPASQSALDGSVCAVSVWRGVDATVVLDVLPILASGAGNAPVPAAITPQTGGSIVLVVGAAATAASGGFSTIAAGDLSNFVGAANTNASNDPMVGIGRLPWSSGAASPAAWTGGGGTAGSSWIAVTLALRPTGRSVVSPFVPEVELGGHLVALFNAKETATITHSGGAVSSWASKVGVVTATQATGTAQPTYSATARNSLPGLSYDGGDALSLTSRRWFPKDMAHGLLFAVARPTSSNYHTIIGYGQTTGGSGNSGKARSLNSDGAAPVGRVAMDVYFDAAVDARFWLNNDRIVVGKAGHSMGTAGCAVRVDGNTETTDGGTAIATVDTSGVVGGTGLTGVIQCAGVINGLMSDDLIQRLEGWMAHEFGLTANLPVGHPYKSVAP